MFLQTLSSFHCPLFPLRKEKNAIILGHFYITPDLQDISDFIGDSLGLSQQVAKTDADIIVFLGVHFMAETAKILNPNKKVLIPDLKAGCSLAESAPADKFAAFKQAEGLFVVEKSLACIYAIAKMQACKGFKDV